jgi:hypothetical protein
MTITFLWPWSEKFRPYVLENGSHEFLSWTRARPTDVLHNVTLQLNVAMQPYQDVSDSTCHSAGIICQYQLRAWGQDSLSGMSRFLYTTWSRPYWGPPSLLEKFHKYLRLLSLLGPTILHNLINLLVSDQRRPPQTRHRSTFTCWSFLALLCSL